MFLCNVSCEIFLYEQVNSAVYYIYSHRPACSEHWYAYMYMLVYR